jgi:hypothetical protein
VSGKAIQVNSSPTDNNPMVEQSQTHPKEKQLYNTTSLGLSDDINNGNDNIHEKNSTTSSASDASTVGRSPTSFLLLLYVILVFGCVLLALLWQESPLDRENSLDDRNMVSTVKETLPLLEIIADLSIQEENKENGSV